MELASRTRSEKQKEFYKLKYDEAIEKFEAGEYGEDQAQFFYEYSYSLVGDDLQDPGEIQRRY